MGISRYRKRQFGIDHAKSLTVLAAPFELKLNKAGCTLLADAKRLADIIQNTSVGGGFESGCSRPPRIDRSQPHRDVDAETLR